MQTSLARGLLAATAVTFAGAAAATAPAAAQVRGAASQDRLERLEGEIRDLQAVVYSVERSGAPVRQGTPLGGQAEPAASPGDVVRIAQMEEEIARLTGRIEELNFRLANQQRQLDTIMAVLGDTRSGGDDGEAMDDRPFPANGDAADADSASESGTGPTDLAGSAPETEDVAVDLPDNEDDAYDVAYEALLAGDYARSEAAFEAYVEQFPDGVRTPEAKYLLGEIYLATGAYAEAATTFLDHVKAYPEDVRAPEAYLKLGTAFARLDKADEACRVFRVGQSKFPEMGENVRARFTAEARRASCEA